MCRVDGLGQHVCAALFFRDCSSVGDEELTLGHDDLEAGWFQGSASVPNPDSNHSFSRLPECLLYVSAGDAPKLQTRISYFCHKARSTVGKTAV